MDSLLVVRLWAAAAWADGKMHSAEAAALRRLIDASELGAQREEALRLLDSADVDPAEVKRLPADAREGVYRAVLGIIKLDGKVTDDEKRWVARLREVIDLDEEKLRAIEAEAR